MSNIISGQSLKLLLKKKGISQQDIIKQFGMHQTTVSRYFTERDKMPADFLLKVAAYAGLRLEDLIAGYTEPHTIDIPHTEVAPEPPAFLKKSNSAHCYSSTCIFSIGDRFSIFL